MKVNELLEIINGFAPLDTACEWDNCGLIVGDKDCEITSVYLTLDADMQALSEAKALGCNTVVSHHPIIFSPVSKLTAENPAYHYIREGISVISVHTPLDMARGGVNDCLARACGLENVRDFMLDGKPLGRIGEIDETDARSFADFIKGTLMADSCACIIKSNVNRVCVVSGSGGSALRAAVEAGCDTLVTGEAKHDMLLLADSLPINLFVLGHFETENIVLDFLKEKLSDSVPCFLSERKSIVEYI
ncbi:MAG: Nif3-like dinuclear metal center hexameric protein [Clostridia bacterium]|nr:Nif3-like dinuclear metal center hexameric protein [Clostridia bacterium]